MPAALMIDLKKSRAIDQQRRQEIQYFLIQVSETLNQMFRPSILKELRFTNGDEVQGLFKRKSDAYNCLRLFRRVVFPLEIHAGIGIGDWTTVVPEYDTSYQDGSAYHNARKAIETAKREKDYIALLCSKSDNDLLWNTMMNAGFSLMEENTGFQNDLAVYFECIYPVYTRGSDIPSNPIMLHELVTAKNEIPKFSKGKSIKGNTINLNTILDGKANTGAKKSSSIPYQMIYEYAHPYRSASILAEAVGAKRQAIDRSLKASNVYAERAIALALIELANRYAE